MYAVLAEQSWTRLCSNTKSMLDDLDSVFMHTTIFQIQQSWIIIVLLLSDCVHAYKWRKWCCKWSSDRFKLPCETVKAGALLSVKCCSFVRKNYERVTEFWTSPSRRRRRRRRNKERKNNILAVWQLSGLVFSWCFFALLGVMLVIKILEDERYIVIKAYKLRDFLYYHILCVHAIPTHRVYRLYDSVMEIA